MCRLDSEGFGVPHHTGHTLSWGGGDASLLTPCYDARGPTGAPGPLDPTRKHTYAVVGALVFFGPTPQCSS